LGKQRRHSNTVWTILSLEGTVPLLTFNNCMVKEGGESTGNAGAFSSISRFFY
jgi:hypothetical protein